MSPLLTTAAIRGAQVGAAGLAIGALATYRFCNSTENKIMITAGIALTAAVAATAFTLITGAFGTTAVVAAAGALFGGLYVQPWERGDNVIQRVVFGALAGALVMTALSFVTPPKIVGWTLVNGRWNPVFAPRIVR